MVLLSLRDLRAHTGRTFFIAAAIALGVALILAARMAGIAAEEVNRQVRADRVAGADLEVTHSTGVNYREWVVGILAGHPEVADAGPLLKSCAANDSLVLLGVDIPQPVRSYHLAAGTFLGASDAAETLVPQGWAGDEWVEHGQPAIADLGRADACLHGGWPVGGRRFAE